MKILFASLFAGVIWYGLFSFVVAVAFLCAVALMLALLAGGLVAGGPVMLCWWVVRYFRRRKDTRTFSRPAPCARLIRVSTPNWL